MKKILLCLSVIFFAACGVDMPKSTPTSYETVTVEKSNIVFPVKFSAKMKGQHDVTIQPQVSGQLMQICVREGQMVKKGDVLFVIDSRNAQLELEAAQANLLAAQATESSAQLEYEGNKNLLEKGIISKFMLENSKNAYDRAKAATSQAKAAADRARVNLGFCTITSPVTGYIGSIDITQGTQVGPGTYLTMVSGNAKMNAEFSINESFLEGRIVSGTNDKTLRDFPDVTFVMKNGNEYPLKGRITSVSGAVDRITGSIACKATFPNPDGVLYSGIQGTIVIPFDVEDVMVIPQVAVVRLQDKSFVYKVQPDSTATAVTITAEASGNGKDVVVTSGLQVGDEIVTVGANNVQEGQQVIF
ncbi:MAG: efflux RND transporter periplasmic adaptor subunit [Paludibacteraceae bacterium]|nr:efflux RND transporter periplasmic adaptor subunit [Paludibacteraceae bacterium]